MKQTFTLAALLFLFLAAGESCWFLLVINSLHISEVDSFQQGFLFGFIVFDQIVIPDEYTMILRGIIDDHTG